MEGGGFGFYSVVYAEFSVFGWGIVDGIFFFERIVENGF